MKKAHILSTGLCLYLAVTGPTARCQGQVDVGTPFPCDRYLSSSSLALVDTARTNDPSSWGVKSPSRAFKHSLLGTLVPLPTIVFTLPGIVFGPSLGYFYGGMPGRAWTGIGLRVVGIGGMISSFLVCGWDCGPGDRAHDIAWVVFLSSGGLTIGSAVYDLATVKSAVGNHNERLKKGTAISIGPTYFADTRTPGIGLTIRF